MCTKNHLLKKLALQAKKRLMNGSKTKTCLFPESKNKTIKKFMCDEDEKFYKKVCKILTENPDIHNPIGKLIDNKIYNTLSTSSKEKYFFDLIDKYAECKIRFEKEKIAI